MTALTAVLLAGGKSRRMGADKATLIFQGQPLWARQLATLKQLSPEKIIISARTKPNWCPPEAEFITDEIPGIGPMAGLLATMQRAETSHLIVLAVDLPHMTSDGLKKIIAAAGPGIGAVVKGEFYEPLCAVYPVNPEVKKLAAVCTVKSAALQPFVEALARKNLLRVLSKTDFAAKCFTNANTPEALA
jgi:molybdopterin-guanine dinucleotide biosynthesis protein A